MNKKKKLPLFIASSVMGLSLLSGSLFVSATPTGDLLTADQAKAIALADACQ